MTAAKPRETSIPRHLVRGFGIDASVAAGRTQEVAGSLVRSWLSRVVAATQSRTLGRLERSSGRVKDRTTPCVGRGSGGKWQCRSASNREGDYHADRGDRAPAHRPVEREISTGGRRCRGWQ